MDLGHPPYTHDYPLGPPINTETEGHTDSIMAKHRKDRDSWGECTYISSFQRALTHRSLFPHNAVEARTLPKWMFISGSTANGLFAFSWQMCIYLHRDVVGWERNNAILSILRVWLRASRAEASGHFFLNKKKKNVFRLLRLKDALISTQETDWAVLVPSRKASNIPSWLYFDHCRGSVVHLPSNYVILHQ